MIHVLVAHETLLHSASTCLEASRPMGKLPGPTICQLQLVPLLVYKQVLRLQVSVEHPAWQHCAPRLYLCMSLVTKSGDSSALAGSSVRGQHKH